MIFTTTSMRPEPTPERVYALCRLALHYPRSRVGMRDLMEPASLNSNQNVFNDVLAFAINARLVQEADDKVIRLHPEAPPDVLRSVHSFRRLMAARAFNDADSGESIFFQFTSWYLAKNDGVFKYKDSGDLASEQTLPFPNFTPVSAAGWRWWAAFLGIGMLHDSFLIPNAAVRIWDAVSADSSSLGGRINMDEFVNWLIKRCPEFSPGINRGDKSISLGVSNGLRTLHDTGLLSLRDISDAGRAWNLFRIDTHALPYRVAELEVKDAAYVV